MEPAALVVLLVATGCAGASSRSSSARTTSTARLSTPSSTTTSAGPTTTTAGPTTTYPPFADDANATVDVDLSGSKKLHATFTKVDGCQSGAPALPFVVLVTADATDGSRIRFSPSLPVATTFALGDPAAASSLEGIVLEVAGTAGTQLSAPQSGQVTFEDSQARAGHFRVTGLQSTTPGLRGEVLDVSWTCG
ncbi:MAG: hypothetical protein JWL73_607 [Actinomycetia bacterium]|nr:hypothetical protein [Actinomycetes bacterium]